MKSIKPSTTTDSNKRTKSLLKTNSTYSTFNNAKAKECAPSTKLVLTDKNQGTGLWCHQPLKKDENLTNAIINPVPPIMKADNFSNEFDKKVIHMLKEQINQLTEQLQHSLIRANEAEYNNKRFEQMLASQTNNKSTQEQELKHLKDSIEEYKNTIFNLNEALNAAKNEIIRLKNCVDQEISKSSNLRAEMKSIRKREDEAQVTFLQNNASKEKTIDSLYHENHGLKVELESTKNTLSTLQRYQNLSENQEEKLQSFEVKYNRVVSELLDLKNKIANEEQGKVKLNQIIKSKNEKIDQLKNELKSFKGLVEQYSSEVKWNQDISTQKESQINVYKEKLKKLDEDLKNATKAYSNLKNNIVKLKNLKGDLPEEEEEILMKLNPKPFLFGPESEE